MTYSLNRITLLATTTGWRDCQTQEQREETDGIQLAIITSNSLLSRLIVTRLLQFTVLLLFVLFSASASLAHEAEEMDEHRLFEFKEDFKLVWKDIVEFFETNEIKLQISEKDTSVYLHGHSDTVKIFAHGPIDSPNQTTVLITTKGSDELRDSLLEHLNLEHTLETDVNVVITDCYKEVTGKEATNINRITRDTDSKLEECVNRQIELSDYRIKLKYSGSENGLIPTINSVVSVEY